MKKTLAATLIGLAILTSLAGSAFAAEMPTEADLNAIVCERIEEVVAEDQTDIQAKGDALIAEIVSGLDHDKLHKAGINLDDIIADVQADLQEIPTTEEIVEVETRCSIDSYIQTNILLP